MNQTQARFTVSFNPNGDSITVVPQVTGGSLFQIVGSTNNIVPNWSDNTQDNKRPVITLVPTSSANYPVKSNSVSWRFHDTAINFAAWDGDNWVNGTLQGESSPSFKGRIHNGQFQIKPIVNLADPEHVGNRQIDFTLDYTCAGRSGSSSGSITVLIGAGGTSAFNIVMIVEEVTPNFNTHKGTGGTTLGTTMLLNPSTDEYEQIDIESTLITAEPYFGADLIPNSNIGTGKAYALDWTIDGGTKSPVSSSTPTQVRIVKNDIEGGRDVCAQLYSTGETAPVAIAKVYVADKSDEYQIVYAPTASGNNYVQYINGVPHNAVFQLNISRNGTILTNGSGFTIDWAWRVENALHQVMHTDTGSTVTVTPDYCITNGKELGAADAQFGEAHVYVEATITQTT